MHIYREIVEIVNEGRSLVLVIVVSAQGSTPQKPGSKALIDDAGRQWGTLGGGLVEAEGLARMRRAMMAGAPELFDYRLDNTYSRDAGAICGGTMRIFTSPNPARNAQAYREALEAIERRERGALITCLRTGSVQYVAEENANGAFKSREEFIALLASERNAILETAAGDSVFVEPIVAPARLLIVGGGHVGQEVAFQAVRLGFTVTVLDDREEFARPELFPPGVRTICGDTRQLVSEFPQDRDSYIVLVSKGHRPDAEALEGCIHGNAAYVGMIGSKRKLRFIRKHFVEDGIATVEEFDRVVAPIGYDIGAVTVPEIGVSIAAQLIAARRKGNVLTTALWKRGALVEAGTALDEAIIADAADRPA